MGRLNVGGGEKRVEIKRAGFAIGEQCEERELYARGNGYYYKYWNDNARLPTHTSNLDRFGTMQVYDNNLNLIRTTTQKGYHDVDEDGNIWRITSSRMQYDDVVIEKLSPDGTTVLKTIQLNFKAYNVITFAVKDGHAYIVTSRVNTYAKLERLIKVNLDTGAIVASRAFGSLTDDVDHGNCRLVRLDNNLLFVGTWAVEQGQVLMEAGIVIDPVTLSKLSYHGINDSTAAVPKRIGNYLFHNRDKLVVTDVKKYLSCTYLFKKDTSSIPDPKRKNLSAKFDILPDFLT